jgi:hypothetical protein
MRDDSSADLANTLTTHTELLTRHRPHSAALSQASRIRQNHTADSIRAEVMTTHSSPSEVHGFDSRKHTQLPCHPKQALNTQTPYPPNDPHRNSEEPSLSSTSALPPTLLLSQQSQAHHATAEPHLSPPTSPQPSA